MAIYLRNNTWWLEYRTSTVRIQKSTGFKKADKKKAQEVFEALRLTMRNKAQKNIAEGLINAIYNTNGGVSRGLPLGGVWAVYEDWMKGKRKKIAKNTLVRRRNRVAEFVTWATDRKAKYVADVNVEVSRAYANYLIKKNLANKTVRNILQDFGGIWRALAQMMDGIHNPWAASVPDDDGTSERWLSFDEDEERRVLEAALELGHDWWLASKISRYTALRYGDVATLSWDYIDLTKRTIEVTPKKTARHGVHLLLPIANELYAILQARANEHGTEGFLLPEHALMHGHQNLKPPFSEVLKKAGVDSETHTFHSWRHTCTSRLSAAGASTEVLRRFGGWTSDEMAHHYDHAKRLEEMASYLNQA